MAIDVCYAIDGETGYIVRVCRIKGVTTTALFDFTIRNRQ